MRASQASPLRQQHLRPKHGVVERAELAKGFELSKGNFIELSRGELKHLEAVASDEICHLARAAGLSCAQAGRSRSTGRRGGNPVERKAAPVPARGAAPSNSLCAPR